jgi:hypothetical protein
MTEPPGLRRSSRIPPSSPVGAGRFVQAALFGYIGVEAVTALTGIVTLLRWSERAAELSSADPFFADGWDFGLGLAFFGIWLLCGIAWIVWQYQAHSNLSALIPTRFRPAAAFWILVPVASLFVPFQAISELTKAGVDRPSARRWWWALYLATNIAVGISSVSGLAEMWLASTILSIVAAGTGIAAALLAVRLISLINTGLETRRTSAGWKPGPPALSQRVGVICACTASILALAGAGTFGLALPEIVRNLPQGDSSSLAFTVGGCFDETGDDFVDVSCEQPHQAEVYHVVQHPDVSLYPGDDEMAEWAEPQCYSRFESYTGVSYQDSALEFGYLYPSPGGWQAGDREVVCYLFDPSGDDLTAPIAPPAA